MAGSRKRSTKLEVKADWEAFLAGLQREVMESREMSEAGKPLAPYAAPDGIIKRNIYALVRERRATGQSGLLEDVLDDLRTASLRKNGKQRSAKPAKQVRNRRKTFKENPFHCALRQLPSEVRTFRGDDLNRIGRQLLYADRHDIDPDLLIGFLSQTGTMKQVAEKAAKTAKVEDWFKSKREAAKLTAVKKSRYPLGIIYFTAISNDCDSCPIEVGFAKARGPNAPVAPPMSILIKPDQSWNFSEKRIDPETQILAQDLLEADTAFDVVEHLAELSDGLSVVHCEDVGNVSNWLTMLMTAAKIDLDFELRDVGDFLDHKAYRRAALRDKFIATPPGPGSAGLNAAKLCEAVRSIVRQ